MVTMRVKFQKGEELKYISHLDLMRLFQRAFRRANIPVKYSQGFNPHPKFSLATALPIGVTSDGEYMDIELEEKISESSFMEKMEIALPKGLKLVKASYIDSETSLMQLIDWSAYIIQFELTDKVNKYEIEKEINSFLSMDEIIMIKIKKKKKNTIEKEVNIRGDIKDISLILFENNIVIIKTTLRTGSKGNLSPISFIDIFNKTTNLNIKDDSVKIHRLELFSEENGKLTNII